MELLFGEIIKSARLAKNLSFKDLAEKMGSSVSHVIKMEMHELLPDFNDMCNLASILEVEELDLFEAIKQAKIKQLSRNLFRSYNRISNAYHLKALENNRVDGVIG
jgi:transcriptional regulator with XRE-family HTH domain